MFTTEFWRDVLERAIATFAQVVLSLASVNISDAVTLDWKAILIAGLIGAGLAVLKGVATSYTGTQTPSLVNYEYQSPSIEVGGDADDDGAEPSLTP